MVSNDKYPHKVIPKFIHIAKKAKLTLERLGKIFMRDGMIEQKMEIFIEMLYNREAVLAWDFIEIRKVKREVASI